MKIRFTLLMIVILTGSQLFSQDRYLDEVFSDVEVTYDVTYGVNATVLALAQAGEAIPEQLKMDIYEPEGDDQMERPLIIYFHTGNFLPHPDNGSPSGRRSDSSAVEIAHRLAKMGYVCAVATYRKGWNPIAPDQQERVFTLINAAYRGVQDARTAVKFFRRTVAEENNPYRVNPDQVVLWGQGTGGYISLNAAALDRYEKIPQTPGGKFIAEIGGNPVPMVLEGVNGDINCDSVGITFPGYPGFPAGDTLNYPNHVGYSGDFSMAVNMGGACGDTSWIEPGQVPVVSYHVPTDPFAPYMGGIVLVPGFDLPVVEVFGSYTVQEFSNRYGNNDAFAGMEFEGDLSATANSRNDGLDGLYPLIGTGGEDDSAPWEWWNPDENPNHQAGIVSNPDMSAEKGRRYLDTIFAYYAPRACVVLGLECEGVSAEVPIVKNRVTISPNPARDQVRIEAKSDQLITGAEIYNMSGLRVQEQRASSTQQMILQRNGLQAGQYIVRVYFRDGAAENQTILFQ